MPQYILDDACRRGEYCKIVCTQPRRIAAVSICRRVSAERNWKEGTVVGYQVRTYTSKEKILRHKKNIPLITLFCRLIIE